MRNLIITLVILMSSCSPKKDETKIEYFWTSTSIKFTEPKFFIEGFPFKSKVRFISRVYLKNIGHDTIDTCLKLLVDSSYQNFFMIAKEGRIKLYPSFYYNNRNYLERKKIAPNDSLNFELESEIIYTTSYSSKTNSDSIYKKAKNILQNVKIYAKEYNQAKEIRKISSYFTSTLSQKTGY